MSSQALWNDSSLRGFPETAVGLYYCVLALTHESFDACRDLLPKYLLRFCKSAKSEMHFGEAVTRIASDDDTSYFRLVKARFADNFAGLNENDPWFQAILQEHDKTIAEFKHHFAQYSGVQQPPQPVKQEEFDDDGDDMDVEEDDVEEGSLEEVLKISCDYCQHDIYPGTSFFVCRTCPDGYDVCRKCYNLRTFDHVRGHKFELDENPASIEEEDDEPEVVEDDEPEVVEDDEPEVVKDEEVNKKEEQRKRSLDTHRAPLVGSLDNGTLAVEVNEVEKLIRLPEYLQLFTDDISLNFGELKDELKAELHTLRSSLLKKPRLTETDAQFTTTQTCLVERMEAMETRLESFNKTHAELGRCSEFMLEILEERNKERVTLDDEVKKFQENLKAHLVSEECREKLPLLVKWFDEKGVHIMSLFRSLAEEIQKIGQEVLDCKQKMDQTFQSIHGLSHEADDERFSTLQQENVELRAQLVQLRDDMMADRRYNLWQKKQDIDAFVVKIETDFAVHLAARLTQQELSNYAHNDEYFSAKTQRYDEGLQRRIDKMGLHRLAEAAQTPIGDDVFQWKKRVSHALYSYRAEAIRLLQESNI